MKRILYTILAVLLALSLGAVAFAEKANYADVPENVWYAEAVEALWEKGLMNGVGDNRFGPNDVFTRAQLATVLYRMAGRPAVSGEDAFTDTASGQWYSDAVLWASQNGVVNGYDDGRFGTNDAATQEQLAVMLWRDAGSYKLDRAKYASAEGVENQASDWAFDAIVWCKAEALIYDLDRFAPKQAANRAQVADMVYRYLKLKEAFADPDAISGATQQADAGSKALVAYFSATGTTEKIAGYVAEAANATIYRITPETP